MLPLIVSLQGGVSMWSQFQKSWERMNKNHNTLINKNYTMCKLYSLILSEKSHEIIEVMSMNMRITIQEEEKKKKRKTCWNKSWYKNFLRIFPRVLHSWRKSRVNNFSPHTSAALQLLLLWHADLITTIFTPVQDDSNLI